MIRPCDHCWGQWNVIHWFRYSRWWHKTIAESVSRETLLPFDKSSIRYANPLHLFPSPSFPEHKRIPSLVLSSCKNKGEQKCCQHSHACRHPPGTLCNMPGGLNFPQVCYGLNRIWLSNSCRCFSHKVAAWFCWHSGILSQIRCLKLGSLAGDGIGSGCWVEPCGWIMMAF